MSWEGARGSAHTVRLRTRVRLRPLGREGGPRESIGAPRLLDPIPPGEAHEAHVPPNDAAGPRRYLPAGHGSTGWQCGGHGERDCLQFLSDKQVL